jgi:hypothetical protein
MLVDLLDVDGFHAAIGLDDKEMLGRWIEQKYPSNGSAPPGRQPPRVSTR